ncbi:MAG: hypothetical protein ACNA8W_14900 [Bradymonadaceae bacterium]
MQSRDVYDEHVSARQMTPGRWSLAFRGIEKKARTLGPSGDEIARRARMAVDVAVETFELEQRYKRDRQASNARGNAQAVDTDSDRTLGSFYRGIEEFTRNYGPQHRLGKMAHMLLKAFYANGLKAVVHQPFEDQFVSMERIVRLGQTEYAAEIAELGLNHWFERIVALTEQYGMELAATRDKTVTWAEVQDARRRCRHHGHRVITAVLFSFGEDTEQDRTRRNELLEPLTLQQRAVYEMQRTRRRVTDIDPTTGVEVESDDLDILDHEEEPQPAPF